MFLSLVAKARTSDAMAWYIHMYLELALHMYLLSCRIVTLNIEWSLYSSMGCYYHVWRNDRHPRDDRHRCLHCIQRILLTM